MDMKMDTVSNHVDTHILTTHASSSRHMTLPLPCVVTLRDAHLDTLTHAYTHTLSLPHVMIKTVPVAIWDSI